MSNRTMQVTVKGPLVNVIIMTNDDSLGDTNSLFLTGFRSGTDRFVVWITALDITALTPRYNSSTEYMNYLDENGIMYAEFGFYEEPNFGNWGVAAGILDRLAKNNAETQFQNADPILSRSILEAFQMWFGPSKFLTDKLYPL